MAFISGWEEREDRVNHILTQGLLDSFREEHKSIYGHTRFGFGNKSEEHLFYCDKTYANLEIAHDGTYGCDTGCDFYTLKGTISCPHDFSVEHDASTFGGLDWVFDL